MTATWECHRNVYGQRRRSKSAQTIETMQKQKREGGRETRGELTVRVEHARSEEGLELYDERRSYHTIESINVSGYVCSDERTFFKCVKVGRQYPLSTFKINYTRHRGVVGRRTLIYSGSAVIIYVGLLVRHIAMLISTRFARYTPYLET